MKKQTKPPRALHVSFGGPPPIGTILSIKGREFEIVDVAPHKRRDGGETNIVTWIADCIDCGVEFDQTTGRSFTSFKRRCDDCRSEFTRERDRINGDP